MVKSAKASILALIFMLLVAAATAGIVNSQTANGKYDTDGDGLIEVSNLEQLDAMRYDLDVDGFPDSDSVTSAHEAAFPVTGAETVCDSNCSGYELNRSLDFNNGDSYASGAVNPDWQTGDGWLPIGGFSTTFDGNGNTISNLYIDRTGSLGLFSSTSQSSIIRSIGLVDIDVTGRVEGAVASGVGGLVGSSGGDVSDSYIVTGGSFRVGVTVTNQGDAQSAATTLRWKQLVDGTTTEIGTVAQRALTRPQSSFKTIRLTAPSTPGTSAYWACVDSVAGESDTTNNCSGKVSVTVTNNLATGAPTISGTAQVGETLRADTSQVEDADGLTNVSYSYQWLSSRDTDIQTATGATYTLLAADEGKTIKVRVTFTDDAGHEETLISAPTTAVAAAAQDNSEDEPSLQSYITVVVTEDESDPDNVETSFTITWSDADDCSTKYNAYFSNRWDGGDTTHLGSAATDESQITSSLSNVEGGGIIFDVKLYCGTEDSGRWVSSVRVPHDDGPSSEESNRRLVPGTYSSEPPLTGLTVGPGILTPTFHSHNFDYTVPDVVSADERLTVVATAKPDYEVVFVKDTSFGAIKTCSPWDSHSCTEWAYTDKDGNRAYPLTDADAKASGFQVDLAADEELTIHVFRLYRTVNLGGHFYHLTVNRTPNSPATGLPTIDGTAQVGETLTVDTSGIADADGLTRATFSYQWLSSRDTEIQDATGSTYTLVPTDSGKTIKVRVTFTDDANNEETLTSAATGAVDAAPTRLTASIHHAPESHDGQNSFTFELRFSEEPDPDFSYKMLRDHAFTVTGGAVTDARRLAPPDNVRWEITVEPSTDAEVSVVLPETADCGDQGAVCTEDGRMLSAEVTLTVAGPGEEEEQTPPENNPATGVPTISGTVQVGETLAAETSGIADEDGLGNATFSYQWIAGGADVEGATGASYTLTEDENGLTIKVWVSFTDDAGNPESLTSAPTAAVAPKPNSPATGAPTISGTVQVGETLTVDTSGIADEDGLTNAVYSYQWQAGGAEIDGATGATYTVVADDDGKTIRVKVSFTDDAGNEETLTSAATATVQARPNSPATGAPTVSGTAQVGETLTADTSGIADTDGLANATFSYQWVSNNETTDTDIAGATDSTYTLASDDEGRTIKVRVSFTDDPGNGESLASASTAAVEARSNLTDRPHDLQATVEAGAVIVTWQDPDTHHNYSTYQISRHRPELGEPEPLIYVDYTQSSSSTFTDTEVEPGVLYVYRVKAVVDFFGSLGKASDAAEVRMPDSQTVLEPDPPAPAETNTPATGAPAITGMARAGETLTADTSGIADADGLSNATFSYQWIRNDENTDSDIDDATLPTYTPVPDDEGKTIKVRVSFTDDAGNDETLTSTATEAVSFAVQQQVANSAATGTPTIIGTVQAGETLTVDTSAISDADGLVNATFVYQWISNNGTMDNDIADETSSTYIIKPWDLGKYIKVRVSFTDDGGNEETLTTAATPAVEASPNEVPTGAPIISGMAEVGQSLSLFVDALSLGIWDGNGMTYATLSYQWIRSDGTTDYEIPDANDPSYTLTDADAGKIINVRVSFTDDGANAEALTSSSTTAVAARPNTSDLDAPTDLWADWSQGEEKGLELNWNAPEGTVTGYQILRKEEPVTLRYWEPLRYGCTPLMEVHVNNTGNDATTYTDTDVAEGAAYTYSVRTINSEGVGSRSSFSRYRVNWPSGLLGLLGSPGIPSIPQETTSDQPFLTGLQYRPHGYWPSGGPGTPYWPTSNLNSTQIEGDIVLTWEAPQEEVTGYQILRRMPEQCEHGVRVYAEIADSTVTRWADSDVEAGTLYEYHIRAINEVGAGGLDRNFTSIRPWREGEWGTLEVGGGEPNNPAQGVPTITGTAQVGETLMADTASIADEDGLDNATFTYQWVRNDGSADADIAGATATTYTLVDADEGKYTKVRVSFTDDGGNEETLTSTPTAVVQAAPTPLTASIHDAPENHDGQNSFTFELRFSEEPDPDFSYRTLQDHAFGVTDGVVRGAQRLERPSNVRWEITVSPDSEAEVEVVLPVTDDCGDAGAICTEDGRMLSVGAVLAVSGPEEDGESTHQQTTESENNPATGAPTISGTSRVGETLTAGTSGIADADGLSNTTFSYQWLADSVEIDGATGSTYTPTTADEGEIISVRVSFTDDADNEETLTSAATAAVEPRPNSPATGAPGITGIPRVGNTLTATTNQIGDEDGLANASFTYQWLHSDLAAGTDTDIQGATGSTYSLVAGDEGKGIRVRVSFTDDAGHAESLTSVAHIASAPSPEPDEAGRHDDAHAVHGQRPRCAPIPRRRERLHL